MDFDGEFIELNVASGGSACPGDSGGPLYMGPSKSIWGLVDFGTTPNCQSNTSSFYQRITRDVALFIHQNAAGVVHFDAHQNPVERWDVNGDGQVTPLDALLVTNYIQANGSGALPLPNTAGRFVDVTGDGQVTPLDALHVINEIQRRGN